MIDEKLRDFCNAITEYQSLCCRYEHHLETVHTLYPKAQERRKERWNARMKKAEENIRNYIVETMRAYIK